MTLLARTGLALLLSAGAVALVAVTGSSNAEGHRVSVVVPNAAGLIAGEDVRAGGRPVGEIVAADVTPEGMARLDLELDDAVWPLTTDANMTVRLGGTIKFSDRYIELERGQGGGRTIAEAGRFPADRFVAPTEFDTLFNTFDDRTRRDMRRFLRNGGDSLRAASVPLARSLEVAPTAVEQVRALFDDLGYRPARLDALLRSSDRVVNAVATANPGVRELIAGASRTFGAVAGESRALADALGETPRTLAATRTTLRQAEGTLTAAADLTDRLEPGLGRLRAVARPLDRVLRTVTEVAPDARVALATLRSATPDLTSLLQRARTPLLPRVESIAKLARPQVACIRPYSPEIGGFAATWSSWWGQGDHKDKILRGQLGPTMISTLESRSTGELKKQFGDALRIAFPRPPGQLVNQSWFQPQCDIGPESLMPEKDPEAAAFDPLGKKLVEFDDDADAGGAK